MVKEILVTISQDGSIYNKSTVASAFKLEPGDYMLSIQPYRVRSLDQNQYYWKVVMPLVLRGLNEAGYNIKDAAAAHTFMKSLFLKKHPDYVEVINKLEKSELTTTTLSTMQFDNYLEDIKWYASEYMGIVIPDPLPANVAVASYDNEVKATIIE